MIGQMTKELIRTLLPLSIRKQLCVLMNRGAWVDADVLDWWTKELLRDFAERDRNAYHRFLWSHHLAYANYYETESRFGKEKIKGSRIMFFSDLLNHLAGSGIDVHEDIHSIFEVGCSLGYQLRHLETDVFPHARELSGVDIDNHAILQGAAYLQRKGSKVLLQCDDMGNLHNLLGDKTYDIIICTGVLMYLGEEQASLVVEEMLRHSKVLVALSGPAHPDIDNGCLGHSVVRSHDGSFIHNFDAMVRRSGGDILARRWEGSRRIDGHTIYFVFAAGSSRREPQLKAVI
jgi:SAM-dependent methyltransferase